MSRVFDKYEIVRRLAYGGVGEVFLARQVGEARFDRLVILKSLRPELAEDPELVEEFLEEARLAATLNHPNIVAIYEVGRWDGTYFIAMEYIRGEDLFRLCQSALAQDHWPPVRTTLLIARDAALGLDAAHQARTPEGKPLHIVHRDVTPRNLMVRTDGVTKVVDFGLAKAIDRAALTITGGLKGTIAYMSPEQAYAEPLDARSDQFSLGVVLWELLAQKRLFGGKDSIEVLEAARASRISPPSTYNEAVPGAVCELCMRMLARDREARFPTCKAAADAMSDVLGDLAGPAGTERVAAFVQSVAGDAIEARLADLTPLPTPLSPTSPPGDAPRRAPPRAAFLVAAGTAALGVGMAAAVWPGEPQEELPRLARVDPVSVVVETGGPVRAEPEPQGTAEPEPDGEPQPAPASEPRPDPVAPEPVVAEPEPSSSRSPAGRPAPSEPDPRPTAPPRRAPVSTEPVGGAVAAPEREEREAPAVLTLDTTPWTQISIDGLTRGATPLYREELSPGRHMVHLVNPEAAIDVWREIVVEPGQVLHLTWDLSR